MSEKRILLVEPDSALSEEWANGLRDYGFKVAVTGDGEDGLVKAEKARPDLVLLRVELPNVNGYTIAKKLKEHPTLKEVPLVLLSSDSTEQEFERHKKTKLKAQGYRKLPLPFDDLVEEVENLIGLPSPLLADFQAEAVPADKHAEVEAARAELLVQVDHLKGELESKSQSEARLEERVAELEKALTEKAGAAAESLQSELSSLRGEIEAIKSERDEAREELDGKKRIINKLKENLEKAESATVETDELREELESKKKVVAKLKENLERLEQGAAAAESLGPLQQELEDLKGDLEGKKKVIAKLKEKIEALEAGGDPQVRIADLEKELGNSKESLARMKETIADLTMTAEEAKREKTRFAKEREQLSEERAGLEKQHQKELESLKALHEAKAGALTLTEKTLDRTKEKVRELEEELEAVARRDREHQAVVARLEEEKSKMEARVVKAYRRLKADESQLEKVRKALEIAMGMTKLPEPASDTGVHKIK